jgi:hypothetical protein
VLEEARRAGFPRYAMSHDWTVGPGEADWRETLRGLDFERLCRVLGRLQGAE